MDKNFELGTTFAPDFQIESLKGDQAVELSELQLALVGGGIGDTVL